MLVAGWLCAACATAQVVTTVVGTDFSFPSQPLPGINAPLGRITGVALDAQGNLYAADESNQVVVRISPDGTLTVVAGNGIRGFSGDGGPATAASLSEPGGVALDAAGNLYIVDTDNHRIRKVSGGIITTVAGNGTAGFSGDGKPAVDAMFNLGVGPESAIRPHGIAVDSAGNLYIADTFNFRIRKVSGGIVTTIAGNGNPGFSGDDGPATSATMSLPIDVAVDAAGKVYIADSQNFRVRVVSGGIISTFAGRLGANYSDGGPALDGSFRPGGIALDAAGNLYIADDFYGTVRKVTGATIATVAGGDLSAGQGFSGDGGPAKKAAFSSPQDVAVDAAGNIFIADSLNQRIRKVNAQTAIVSTLAGTGGFRFSGDGGPALNATLNFPTGLALDAANNLYIADQANRRIRKVSGGNITTAAGTGEAGIPVAGPASSTRFRFLGHLAVDSAGAVYAADYFFIQKLAGGVVSVPGNALDAANGVAVDPTGTTLYVVERDRHRVSRISGGIRTTIAGTGTSGFSGDLGPAVNAQLFSPEAVALDSAGDIYIADAGNSRVRKISGGIITTVAGGGTQLADGVAATSAMFDGVTGLLFDSAGSLFIADRKKVRKVSGGIITTVAGSGDTGFSGDGGLATKATFRMSLETTGLALDAAGNLFIADRNNNRIRAVLAAPPKVQASPAQLQFTAASAGRIPPAQTVSFVGEVPGLLFSAQSSASWLRVSPATDASPRFLEVIADPTTLQPGAYTGAITITAPNASPASTTVQVAFTVTAPEPPRLSLDKVSLSFPFPKDGRPRSQPLLVSNVGGTTLPFTAKVKTNTGGTWLSVSPASGQALPSAAVTLTVTADPSGLPPGAYSGSLTVNEQTLPVTMTISAISQAILLSQTGLSFLGVSQGGILPPQSFGVINIGTGTVNWSVSKSTLSGGPDWLQIGVTRGSTSDVPGAAVPSVSVTANPSILPAGKYYGLVRVDAPGAANSPQFITVFLQVLAAGSDIGAAATPSEQLFSTTTAAGSPGSQDLLLYNVATAPKTFRSSVTADAGLRVVTLPVDGTLDPQQPTRIVVQPFTDGLAPGVYNGTVSLQFSDGRVRALRFSVVVAAAPAKIGSAARNADTCTPTKLLTALTTLGQSFAVSAGWPVALGVDVKDDCGTALDAGSVVVSPSNGDLPLNLRNLGGGHWETTWQTRASASQVVLKVQATDSLGTLRGEREIQGTLQAQTDPPVFDKPGIVSAAAGKPFVPLAPGSIVSIYGERLAQTTQVAGPAPLPPTLGSTTVLIGGQIAPLYFVSPGQVNVQVPFGITTNTPHQILVQQGLTLSRPVTIDVAPAQPSVFVDYSVSLTQGIIFAVRNEGATQRQFEAKPGSPATAGDGLVIYCAGLGMLDSTIADGAAATGPSNTKDPVQVTIGGRTLAPFYAGLTPAFIGLYQVNVTVPAGLPIGDAVPVTLSVAGQTSAEVTIAVQ